MANRRGRAETGGGNFLFALLSMILLEFACRTCQIRDSSERLRRFSSELEKADKKYFTPLPNMCGNPKDFKLPSINGNSDSSPVIAMLYDLIRNGNAHQYNSTILSLPDGQVDVAIIGAATGRSMYVEGLPHRAKHLGYLCETVEKGRMNLFIYFAPDEMFRHLKKAILDSCILNPSDKVEFIQRPRGGGTPHRASTKDSPQSGKRNSVYDFKVQELLDSLKRGGHLPVPITFPPKAIR